MQSKEPALDPYESLKQRLVDQLREPLLVAIEREFSRMMLHENIVLSRKEYRRLKWEVVRAIVNGGE